REVMGMKRCIPVFALALAAAIGSAHADYIRISYNLGILKKASEPAAPGPRAPGPSPRPDIPGGPGIKPGGPGRGAPPTLPGTQAIEEDSGILKAEAVVEYTRHDLFRAMGPDRRLKVFPRITHRWGKTA